MSRVRAQFPDQSEFALIQLEWLERARLSAIHNPVEDTGGRLVAGVDVGGGQSETVVYVCESTPDLHRIVAMGAWRGADTRGEVLRFLDLYRMRLSIVHVDSIGIGHNFGLHLRDHRYPIDFMNVSLPCEAKPHFQDSDPARRFANKKAQSYQGLADAFERNQIEGGSRTRRPSANSPGSSMKQTHKAGSGLNQRKALANAEFPLPTAPRRLCWPCATRRRSLSTLRHRVGRGTMKGGLTTTMMI
jgi:hypothetical protein